MDKRSKWAAGGWSAQVYFTIARAGDKGMVFRELSLELNATGCEVSRRAIENAVMRLKQQGLVVQPLGRFTPLAVDHAMPPAPYADVALRFTLLELLADCPGGCSESVLATDAGVCRAEVAHALRPQLESGAISIIQVPGDPGLGGGLGYCMGQAAPAPVAAASTAAPALPQPVMLGQHGRYELQDGKLAITWGYGALRAELPKEVTRELFSWLDALGGLHLSEQVGAAEGAAS